MATPAPPERPSWVCTPCPGVQAWRPGQMAWPTLAGGVWPEHPTPLSAGLSHPALVITQPPAGLKGTNLPGDTPPPLWPPREGKQSLGEPKPHFWRPQGLSLAAEAQAQATPAPSPWEFAPLPGDARAPAGLPLPTTPDMSPLHPGWGEPRLPHCTEESSSSSSEPTSLLASPAQAGPAGVHLDQSECIQFHEDNAWAFVVGPELHEQGPQPLLSSARD